MHDVLRRFLVLGFAFSFFIACGGNGESGKPPGSADAEEWNRLRQEEGVPLALLDTLEQDAFNDAEITEPAPADTPGALESRLLEAGLIDVQTLAPDILVDLKYATTDNFLHRDVYEGLRKCYLQPEAAEKLARANALLQSRHPQLRLLVYDAIRPRSVQFAMWRIVKGTPQESYVASPKSGSIHNYGAAVDLTLADARGNPLDMGTPFDYFGQKAQPRYEDALLASGELAQKQVENRRLLRSIMLESGFSMIRNEWWHFNAFPSSETRQRYDMIE